MATLREWAAAVIEWVSELHAEALLLVTLLMELLHDAPCPRISHLAQTRERMLVILRRPSHGSPRFCGKCCVAISCPPLRLKSQSRSTHLATDGSSVLLRPVWPQLKLASRTDWRFMHKTKSYTTKIFGTAPHNGSGVGPRLLFATQLFAANNTSTPTPAAQTRHG